MTDLIPTAEPFFFPAGPVGAVLVHGFTGTPKEMRPLGEALAAQGTSVLGVRLAQHAACPEDMQRSHWRDWYNSVLDGYFLLRGCCPQVFVMGLSMGGILALRLAAHQPVRGVVAMSTPSLPLYQSMDWRARYAGLFGRLQPYASKGPSLPPENALQAQHVAYPDWPTRAIPHLRTLLWEMESLLPRVTVPVLVVHSRDDEGVGVENAEYIHARLGSRDRQLLWLEHSHHVVTEGEERTLLFQRIQAFMQAHLAPA